MVGRVGNRIILEHDRILDARILRGILGRNPFIGPAPVSFLHLVVIGGIQVGDTDFGDRNATRKDECEDIFIFGCVITDQLTLNSEVGAFTHRQAGFPDDKLDGDGEILRGPERKEAEE